MRMYYPALLDIYHTLTDRPLRKRPRDKTVPPEEVIELSAPTDLTAVLYGTNAVDLSWTDTNDQEIVYQIERRSSGAYAWIASAPANATTYRDTDRSYGITYYYRVRAVAGSNTSDYSTSASITIPPIPSAPSNLTAEASGVRQIDLAWQENSGVEAGFQISRRLAGGLWSTIHTTDADVTTYADTTVVNGETYYYRVRAVNEYGTSTYSNTASAATLLVVPAAPTSLTASYVGDDQISLEWQETADNESGFRIEYRPQGGTSWALLGEPLPPNSVSALVELNPGTWQFRLRAYNDAGNSAYSNTATETIPAEVTVPDQPTNLVVVAGDDPRTADLTWDEDDTPATVYFSIEYSNDSGNSWNTLQEVDGDERSVTLHHLFYNIPYLFRVIAVNGDGQSLPSEPDGLTLSSDGILAYDDFSVDYNGEPLEFLATGQDWRWLHVPGSGGSESGGGEEGNRIRCLTADGSVASVIEPAIAVQPFERVVLSQVSGSVGSVSIEIPQPITVDAQGSIYLLVSYSYDVTEEAMTEEEISTISTELYTMVRYRIEGIDVVQVLNREMTILWAEPVPVTVNAGSVLSARADGDDLKVYVDDTLVGTITGATFASEYYGFGIAPGQVGSIFVDDFTVSAPTV